MSLSPNLISKRVIDETLIMSKMNNQFAIFSNPDIEIMSGLKWGCQGELFTPAYWKSQYLLSFNDDNYNLNYRLGENILEEIIACLLGGFGLKSEIGLLAFERLKLKNLIKKNVSKEKILSNLKEPFWFNGKHVRYRFPNQKAIYISKLLNRDDLDNIPLNNDLELRDWLLTVNGIGMKTASWIVRNFLHSENVAIIDIHIYRAFILMGLYNGNYDIKKDYNTLEDIFLLFCKRINVKPSLMDALMWLHMKHGNALALKTVKLKN